MATNRSYGGHEDLLAYKKAKLLEARIVTLVNGLPRYEAHLRDQLSRASANCPIGVAEAYGRRDYTKDLCARLRVVSGELNEVRSLVDTARLRGYISDEQAADLDSGYQEFGRLIGGMLRCPEKFHSRHRRTGPNEPRNTNY